VSRLVSGRSSTFCASTIRRPLPRRVADTRLDRQYEPKGPLLNRIIVRRIRSVLVLNGQPLPPVAPRGMQRPTPEQAALEKRLNALAEDLHGGEEWLKPLAGYVRREGPSSAAGPLAQEAVGRLFVADTTQCRKALRRPPSSTARRGRSIRLCLFRGQSPGASAARRHGSMVHGDPAGVHATGIAMHNMVASLQRMRALWSSPGGRQLPPQGAVMQCLAAPAQVMRQPPAAGGSGGKLDDTTLVLLRLEAARAQSQRQGVAFLAQSWSRCPAYAWVPALLSAVWRTA
jgi:hypothetical protein